MSGSLVLVGLSGSGKSTIGRSLSARIGLPLVDTDRLIEEQAGKPVAAIFAGDGEGVFRDLEETAVCNACLGPAIVAAGGGAVLRAANRRTMRRGNLVVWLDLPLGVLAQRLASHTDDEERPLLRGDVHDRLRLLWQSRRPLYAQTAHVRIGGNTGLAGSHRIAATLDRIYRTWKDLEAAP
jgi:shikimate kinase